MSSKTTSAPSKPQQNRPHRSAAVSSPLNSKVSAEMLDKQLRQITGTVLNALKSPTAIPSNIILAALKSARQI